MVKKKDTFTSSELCARYGCVLRTIHAKQKKNGYPPGVLFGKELVFSMPKVIAWERIHMPHLHNGEAVHDDADEWQKMKDGTPPETPAPNGKRPRTRRKK